MIYFKCLFGMVEANFEMKASHLLLFSSQTSPIDHNSHSRSSVIPTGTPESTSLKTSFLWCLWNFLWCEAPRFLSLWQMTEIIMYILLFQTKKKIHWIKQAQIITQRKDLKVLPPCRIDGIWESRNSNSHYWFLYIDGVYQIEILYLICKYRCYMLI